MTAISSSPEARAAQQALDKHRGRFVPWIIGAFYLSFMTALIGFVFIAYAHPPSEITAEAYDKGLAYNDTLAKAAAQRALGWSSETAYENGRLTFSLRDSNHRNIDHAQVRAWFIHPNNAAMDRQFDLGRVAPGVYSGMEKLPTRGLWTVRVTALAFDHEYQDASEIEAK